MNSDLPEHTQRTIESVCELGCTRVNQIITAVDQGTGAAELEGLSYEGIMSVHHELHKIMEVYAE